MTEAEQQQVLEDVVTAHTFPATKESIAAGLRVVDLLSQPDSVLVIEGLGTDHPTAEIVIHRTE